MQAEKAQAQADERKREKEAARLRRERLQVARDVEARAEAPNVPEALRPSEEELGNARLLREQVSAARGNQHVLGMHRIVQERAIRHTTSLRMSACFGGRRPFSAKHPTT
jgi:hypothetical protein